MNEFNEQIASLNYGDTYAQTAPDVATYTENVDSDSDALQTPYTGSRYQFPVGNPYIDDPFYIDESISLSREMLRYLRELNLPYVAKLLKGQRRTAGSAANTGKRPVSETASSLPQSFVKELLAVFGLNYDAISHTYPIHTLDQLYQVVNVHANNIYADGYNAALAHERVRELHDFLASGASFETYLQYFIPTEGGIDYRQTDPVELLYAYYKTKYNNDDNRAYQKITRLIETNTLEEARLEVLEELEALKAQERHAYLQQQQLWQQQYAKQVQQTIAAFIQFLQEQYVTLDNRRLTPEEVNAMYTIAFGKAENGNTHFQNILSDPYKLAFILYLEAYSNPDNSWNLTKIVPQLRKKAQKEIIDKINNSVRSREQQPVYNSLLR
jgi:hypothetical protein